jgi:hypothetical protein
MSEPRRTREDQDGKQESRENWAPSAMPFDLTPQELREEPFREVRPAEIRPAEAPMVSFGDRGPSELRPTESRYEFVEPVAMPLELRHEQAEEIRMLEIPMTGFEMRELRERRIAARDLGWKVPGVRIRIE